MERIVDPKYRFAFFYPHRLTTASAIGKISMSLHTEKTAYSSQRALRSGMEALENWLDGLEPNIIHVAIGILLLSLLGVVGIILGTFLHLTK